MSSKEEFKAAKRALKEVQTALESRSNKAEVHVASFQRLSEEIYGRIVGSGPGQRLLTSPDFVAYFVKSWFEKYLAHKDEVVVLLKGELIRSYHITEHRQWIHTRERMRGVYNKKYSLTMCSKDGIDYEYTTLGGASKDSLNSIASKNDTLSDRLEDLGVRVDTAFRTLEKALKQRGWKDVTLNL